MEKTLVNRFRFGHEEIRQLLRDYLIDKGEDLSGETRVLFDGGSIIFEEFISPNEIPRNLENNDETRIEVQ